MNRRGFFRCLGAAAVTAAIAHAGFASVPVQRHTLTLAGAAYMYSLGMVVDINGCFDPDNNGQFIVTHIDYGTGEVVLS